MFHITFRKQELKENDSYSNKHFKLSHKRLITISVVIVISVGITAFVGLLFRANS